MNIEDKTKRYKELQVHTVSQEKLILMLYDGAISFLNIALSGLEEKKYDVANNNLGSLYQYMYDKLIEANIQKNRYPVDEVIDMLVSLREAWVHAVHELSLAKTGSTDVDDSSKRSGLDFVG